MPRLGRGTSTTYIHLTLPFRGYNNRPTHCAMVFTQLIAQFWNLVSRSDHRDVPISETFIKNRPTSDVVKDMLMVPL